MLQRICRTCKEDFSADNAQVHNCWPCRNRRSALRDKAHTAVFRAIRSGLLQPEPCEVCGADLAQAHHDDYSAPLIVRWLCITHHRQHHADVARQATQAAAT